MRFLTFPVKQRAQTSFENRTGPGGGEEVCGGHCKREPQGGGGAWQINETCGCDMVITVARKLWVHCQDSWSNFYHSARLCVFPSCRRRGRIVSP